MIKPIEAELHLKAVTDVQDVSQNVKEIQNLLNKLNLSPNLKGQFDKIFGSIEGNIAKATQSLSKGFKNNNDVKTFSTTMNKIGTELVQLKTNMGKIDSETLRRSLDPAIFKEAEERIKELQSQLNGKIDLSQLKSAIDSFKATTKSSSKAPGEFFKALGMGDIEGAKQQLESFKTTMDRVKPENRSGYETMFNQMSEALQKIQSDGSIGNIITEITQLQQGLNTLEVDNLQQVTSNMDRLTKEDMSNVIKGFNEASNGAVNLAQGMATTNTELDQFKSRIVYFFGLNNAVQLLRRSLRAAYETVKDLDEVMTETAVVTSFDVGDMWSQLPEYAARASKLGVSIHDAYEAATLYYQQGLKTNQVVAISNETLKMARIAGLDAATATDRMTNALRGFNMEINETNAQRVNDVYSKLAAITASNTDEISTAMTKVASLAHNANMEFETTAAFLSQIIETTRESAETAGTALKTVVARFSEVKDLYGKGELIGADEEGQEIDVNRVSEALRSAGISLNEYLTGAKGLDDIFLDLASKWDSLDQVQQRYIATMAAGSRQQSRFIAMMSDYKRTSELVEAANTANGASQLQFNKTLESLETKLARLKDAWDTFVMGLANQDFIKGAVDSLTSLLTTINKLLDVLSGGNGKLKSFESVLLGIGAFSVGKGLISGTGLGGKMKSGIQGILGTGSGGGQSPKAEPEVDPNSLRGTINHAAEVRKSGSFDELTKNVTAPSEKARLKNRYDKEYKAARKSGENKKNAREIAYNKTKESNSKTLEKYDKKAEKAAENVNNTTKAEQNAKGASGGLKTALSGVADNYERLGQTAMMAGTAMLALSAVMGAFGADDEAVEWVQKIGLGLTAIGAVMPLVTAIVKVSTKIQEEGWKKVALAEGAALLPALLIAVALAAIIALIVLIVKAIKGASLEERLEKAAEATKRAADEAKAAKDAYNELSESHNQYNDLQDKLDSLTEGTQAWKEALLEANQQVSDLLVKYPQLAKYIQVGKDGQLTISDAGWEKVISDQRAAVVRAQNAQYIDQIQYLKLQNEKAIKDAGESGRLYQQYGDKVFSGNEIQIDDKTKEEIANLRSTIEDNTLQTDVLSETMMRLSASDETAEYKYADLLSKVYGKQTKGEGFQALADKYHDDLYEGAESSNNLSDSDLAEDIAEEYNIKLSGNDDTDLRRIYAAMKGILYEDVKKNDMSDAELRGEIANMWAAKDLQDNMEELRKTLQNGELTDSEQGQFLALLSGSGEGLSLDELTNIKLEDYLSKLGMTSEKLADLLGYKDVDVSKLTDEQLFKYAESQGVDTNGKTAEDLRIDPELLKTVLAEELFNIDQELAAEKLQSQVKDVLEKFKAKGVNTEGIEGLSIELVKKLGEQTENMTKTTAQNYVDAVTNVLNDPALDDQEKSALENLIADAELTNLTSLESLYKDMAKMGIDKATISEFWLAAVDGVKTFKSSLEEVTQSAESVRKSIVAIDDQATRLAEGKGTESDIMAYLKAGADMDDFELTDEGWQLKEEAIDKATKALKQYTLETQKAELADMKQNYNFITKAIQEQNLVQKALVKDATGNYISNLEVLEENERTALANYFGVSVASLETVLTKYKDLLNDGVNTIIGQEKIVEFLEKSVNSTVNSRKNANKAWKNPYDQLYNLQEKINESLRTREKLERRYDRILKARETSAAELHKAYLDEIAALERQIDLQRQLIDGRKQQLDNIANESVIIDDKLTTFKKAGVTQYAKYNQSTGLIEIDYSAIGKIKDSNKQEAVEAYVSRLEELSEQFEEAQDTLEEQTDELEEIRRQNEESYLELEDRVLQALIDQEQKTIDEYQKLSDTISDTNSKVIEQLREQIDLERQIRDNTKTEKDLSEKEARLAYLKRDTSGANELEILNLQKELEEGYENYQDQLIDQTISQMEKDNQLAADQRQAQIDLLQAQLEFNQANGELWGRVEGLIRAAYGGDGELNINSEMIRLLEESDAFKGMSTFGKDKWIEEMADAWAQATIGRTELELGKAEKAGSMVLANGTKITYDKKTGIWTDRAGNTYGGFQWNGATGQMSAMITPAVPKEIIPQEPVDPNDTDKDKTNVVKKVLKVTPSGPANTISGHSETSGKVTYLPEVGDTGVLIDTPPKGQAIQVYEPYLGTNGTEYKLIKYDWDALPNNKKIKEIISINGKRYFRFDSPNLYIPEEYYVHTVSGLGSAAVPDKKKISDGKIAQYAFKTGGLADFTGPAWLDGTKSKPELVLNARDTQNFIVLKDLLASLRSQGQFGLNEGSKYYDIDINVDELGDDYDVEQLARKVKQEIANDSNYRNVNAINFIR